MKRSILLLPFLLLSSALCAQSHPTASQTAAPTPPSPATKMEEFKPAVGSVVTFGYDDLGRIRSISVDVREIRDSKGASARGLLVEVIESDYRKESSFVDMDEIPELLKGFDALMQVSANPTPFKNFEVRYTTKGALQLTAFNSSRGGISYAVQTGRVVTAHNIGLTVIDMQQLRALFESALQKLSSLSAAK